MKGLVAFNQSHDLLETTCGVLAIPESLPQDRCLEEQRIREIRIFDTLKPECKP
jgi:hypothetical protein